MLSDVLGDQLMDVVKNIRTQIDKDQSEALQNKRLSLSIAAQDRATAANDRAAAAAERAAEASENKKVNLTQLPNYTELTSLYDQYMIKGIRVNIQPLLTEGIASAVSGSTNIWGYPKLSTVIDYDDSTIPASEDVYMQYSTLRQTGAFKEHKRYFKPKCRLAGLDAGATITANTVRGANWIDTGVPTVPHYGLKVFQPGPIASGTPLVSSSIAYSVYATMYVACKNVR